MEDRWICLQSFMCETSPRSSRWPWRIFESHYIAYLATTSDSVVAADRTEAIRAMMGDIISCKEREDEIREQMPEHCKRIMASKRLALFEKLVADVGHGDTTIAAEMAVGFDVVGKIPRSQVYRKKKRPATLSVSELRRCAPKTRKAIYHSCKGSGDFDMDMAVYEATRDELKRGWLHGPCAFDELLDHSTVMRRFGVKQGAKTRPIDNYTESLVNLTTSAGETIALRNVDAICAMLGFWRTLTGDGGTSEVVLKTCDLHKAYKQLCVSNDALDDSSLAVWNPETKRTEVYGQYVLPFGSCASVHAFWRSSFAIWFVGVRKFRLMWSSYFDDFVIFSKPALSKRNDFVLKTFFQALGWAVSLDKDCDFGPIAKVLGMEIDLAESHLARTVVRNTLERKNELKSLLDAVLDSAGLAGKTQVASQLNYCRVWPWPVVQQQNQQPFVMKVFCDEGTPIMIMINRLYTMKALYFESSMITPTHFLREMFFNILGPSPPRNSPDAKAALQSCPALQKLVVPVHAPTPLGFLAEKLKLRSRTFTYHKCKRMALDAWVGY